MGLKMELKDIVNNRENALKCFNDAVDLYKKKSFKESRNLFLKFTSYQGEKDNHMEKCLSDACSYLLKIDNSEKLDLIQWIKENKQNIINNFSPINRYWSDYHIGYWKNCYDENDLSIRKIIVENRKKYKFSKNSYSEDKTQWFSDEKEKDKEGKVTGEVAFKTEQIMLWTYSNKIPKYELKKQSFQDIVLDPGRINWPEGKNLFSSLKIYIEARIEKTDEKMINEPMNFFLYDLLLIVKGMTELSDKDDQKNNILELKNYIFDMLGIDRKPDSVIHKHYHIETIMHDLTFLKKMHTYLENSFKIVEDKIESRPIHKMLENLGAKINKIADIISNQLNLLMVNEHRFADCFYDDLIEQMKLNVGNKLNLGNNKLPHSEEKQFSIVSPVLSKNKNKLEIKEIQAIKNPKTREVIVDFKNINLPFPIIAQDIDKLSYLTLNLDFKNLMIYYALANSLKELAIKKGENVFVQDHGKSLKSLLDNLQKHIIKIKSDSRKFMENVDRISSIAIDYGVYGQMFKNLDENYKKFKNKYKGIINIDDFVDEINNEVHSYSGKVIQKIDEIIRALKNGAVSEQMSSLINNINLFIQELSVSFQLKIAHSTETKVMKDPPDQDINNPNNFGSASDNGVQLKGEQRKTMRTTKSIATEHQMTSSASQLSSPFGFITQGFGLLTSSSEQPAQQETSEPKTPIQITPPTFDQQLIVARFIIGGLEKLVSWWYAEEKTPEPQTFILANDQNIQLEIGQLKAYLKRAEKRMLEFDDKLLQENTEWATFSLSDFKDDLKELESLLKSGKLTEQLFKETKSEIRYFCREVKQTWEKQQLLLEEKTPHVSKNEISFTKNMRKDGLFTLPSQSMQPKETPLLLDTSMTENNSSVIDFSDNFKLN